MVKPKDAGEVRFVEVVATNDIQAPAIFESRLPEIRNQQDILDNLDKILELDLNMEVLDRIEDPIVRQNVVMFQNLMKQRIAAEEKGEQLGPELENKIIEVLQVLKGPDYT